VRLRALVYSTTGSPMVTQCGQILVPSACAAFLIVDFVNKHAGEARMIRQQFERSVLTTNSSKSC